MDTIGQFYTKRNSTNSTPIKKRKVDELDAYKKDTDWTILDVDWTPIEIDWTIVEVNWK